MAVMSDEDSVTRRPYCDVERLGGGALPDRTWRVGIQHPKERQQVAAVVEGDDFAVATSGTYVRGEHVFDPHTRRPPEGVLTMTIIGPDLGTADAFATAASAIGVNVLADGRSLRTPAFRRRLHSIGKRVARPQASEPRERR